METRRLRFRVECRDINYLRITIESYDGIAVVRTLDPQAALIEVQVAPGCEHLLHGLLESLVKEEGIRIQPEPSRIGVLGQGGKKIQIPKSK